MTDILIPLNGGSRHEDIELKYCLRSITKHLTGVDKIFIVGHKPSFLNWNLLYHIPFRESINNWERAWNIYRKIKAGIDYKDEITVAFDYGGKALVRNIYLSDKFLFMNDDHFLLEDYEADKFVDYCRPLQQEMYAKNPPQYKQMENTVGELRKNPVFLGSPFFDFDIHCPIVFEKKSFVNIFDQLPTTWPEYGYGIKTFYATHILTKQAICCEDLKFKEPLMKSTIYTALEGRSWFSIGDRCLKSGAMKEVLEELYPIKSIYELR